LGGNYDLIGWDPRGTGKTIPFNCGLSSGPTPPPSDNQRRDVTVQRNLTDFLFEGGWASAELFADTCEKTMNATGELIGTAFVVRDMVEIIDALGEDGLLRYWGLSYGTQLGSTFAAMFPERVDRMLLDAVTNPHEYVSGTWMHSLLQADKAYRAFLTECANAPKKCSLAPFVGPNATADDLQEAIDAGLQQLLEISTVRDGTLTYGFLKFLLYRGLYDPYTWSSLADTLVSLLNGTFSTDTTSTPPTDADSPAPYTLGRTSFEGIKCSDAVWRANSAEEILDIVEEQSAISSFSDVFYDQSWRCAAWKMDAKEKYTGNFTAKTKFPILLVGGAYDPVTPLVSAFNTSVGFENSVVLTHKGYGVCAIV
jgi:pimeloyl-ACP methyl ester carboxylesterase